MPYKDPNDPRAKKSRIKHYNNNKQAYKDNSNKKKASLRRFLKAVKSYPCIDCGVSYPSYVMQFDHLPGLTKLYEPGRLVNTGSWNRVVEEIMKCEEVCANCHAERTHSRITLDIQDVLGLHYNIRGVLTQPGWERIPNPPAMRSTRTSRADPKI